MPDCRCGHPEEWHRHMHTRDYCGVCDCRSYRQPPGRFWRWVEWLVG